MKIEYLADRPEFISTLATWHRREWDHYRPDETVEARATKLLANSGRFEIPTVLIATLGDALLGSAMLVAHDMDTRPQWSPWLAGLVVAPEHRRRGIGTALADAVVAEARKLGFGSLYLFTFTTEQFYSRLGWRFVERAAYLVAEVTVMVSEIKEPDSTAKAPRAT